METRDFAVIDAMMRSPDSSDRRRAASLLAEVGGEAAVERLLVLLKDANSGVREAVQGTLTFLGGRKTVEKIAPLLKETDPGIRNAAIDILRKIGDEGLDILEDLARREKDVRLFVLDILGTIGNPDSLEVLTEGLRDRDPNVRNAAVISLGMLGDERAFEHLKVMMDDEEWIRFSAIEALAQMPGEQTVNFLMNQLERMSSDELTVSAILENLGRLKPRKCVPALVERLKNTSAYMETAIVQTLLAILSPEEIGGFSAGDTHVIKSILDRHIAQAEGEMLTRMLLVLSRVGDRQSISAMIELARGTDPDTQADQWSALTEAFTRIHDAESMVELLDMDDKLRILGANVLAKIGGEAGAREITRRIFSCQGYVKRALTDALAAIGDPSTSETFLKLIHEGDGHVISSSLRALGTFANPEDIREIEPFLAHRYPDVRESALNGIVRIGTMQAEELFVRMAEDPDPSRCIIGLSGLSRIKGSHLQPSAHRLLKNDDPGVRAAAAGVIRDEDLPIAIDTLAELLHDEHEQIRYMAMDIVGMKRIQDLRPHLENALSGRDMWAASHAIEGMRAFHDERAKAKLLALLEHGSDFLRISSAKALGRWGDESLAQEMEPHLDDPNPDVARAIAEAIDSLQGGCI
ncbi:MAG: HEAT repeat domain-containing protein [Syntrophaceae bacterium]